MRFLKFFMILVCFLIVSGQVSAQPKSAFSVLSFNTLALMPGDDRLRDVVARVVPASGLSDHNALLAEFAR